MKNFFIYFFSLLFLTNLYGSNTVSKFKKIPLNFSLLSVENGGSLSAIDAFSDGVGIYVAGLGDRYFLSINNLVYKYGDTAKNDGLSLKEFVLNSPITTSEEKTLATLLGNASTTNTVIGEPCDDNNPNTINDQYLDTNGTCLGISNSLPSSLSITGWNNLLLGSTNMLSFSASDSDNDSLTYSFDIFNETLNTVVNSYNLNTSNTFSLNISSPTFLNNNSYKVILKVSDGKGTETLSSNSLFVQTPTFFTKLSNGVVTCPDAIANNQYQWDSNNDGITETWWVSPDDRIALANKIKGSNGVLDNGGDDFPSNRICTTKLTDMTYLFAKFTYSTSEDLGLGNINNYHDITTWDTSSVTTMYYTFSNTPFFNQDINNWDVSKVSNMNYTFSSTKLFNMPLNKWNTSNVTNMAFMFAYSQKFNQSLNSFDFSKVTTLFGLFQSALVFNNGCSANITTCPTNWNVSNVTSLQQTFYSAPLFNQSLSSWNVSKVTSMREMFSGASKFNQPLSSWNTSNVTNMVLMFNSATYFDQNISTWNVTKVTSWSNFRISSGLSYFNTPVKFR